MFFLNEEGKLSLSLLYLRFCIYLVRETLFLSGKSQGKLREFQDPVAVVTMLLELTNEKKMYIILLKVSVSAYWNGSFWECVNTEFGTLFD